MTNVNSASDSINARPRIRKIKIPGRAPGLRASATVAEAVALTLAQAAKTSRERHADTGGDRNPRAGQVSPAACANAGVASSIAAIDIKNTAAYALYSSLLLAPVSLAASGWLRLTVQAPSRWIGGSTHLRQGAPAQGNLKL